MLIAFGFLVLNFMALMLLVVLDEGPYSRTGRLRVPLTLVTAAVLVGLLICAARDIFR